MRASQVLDVAGELLPARESVLAGDEELRGGQGAGRQTFRRGFERVPVAFELLCFMLAASRALPVGTAVHPRQRLDPARGPLTDRARGALFAAPLDFPSHLLPPF